MRSNDRAFLLLEHISEHEFQTLAEIADQVELPRPTTLRFLRALEQRGWISRDDRARYSLGPAVIALAHRYLSRTPVLSVAAKPMQELRDELGETISLSALAGTRRICIQEYVSPEPLRHVHEVGSVAPLHAGASGRLLLAYLTPEARAEVLASDLPELTATTLTDSAALERDCDEIRARGWTISHGEKTRGSVALAVPIDDATTGSVYALAVFAPAVRFDADRNLEMWIAALTQRARQIEEVIGAHPQAPTRS
ncbi:MAG TPA: IclR family transcriptional regulator [Conexibacter sp.]|jgi:DNA-binding IclR family transcriptional regulator